MIVYNMMGVTQIGLDLNQHNLQKGLRFLCFA